MIFYGKYKGTVNVIGARPKTGKTLFRDGITKESTDTASGSDRIVWLCSNFTIYKRKSDEEIAKDGPEN